MSFRIRHQPLYAPSWGNGEWGNGERVMVYHTQSPRSSQSFLNIFDESLKYRQFHRIGRVSPHSRRGEVIASRATRNEKQWQKVINNPSASRARGMTYVCHTGHTHTGIINNTCLSDHAHVRARAIPQEFIAAWRERIFAEGMEDSVKADMTTCCR